MRMYDSVTVADLPAGADAYAGYVDGRYANYGALRARFPSVPCIGIAVTAADDADALDCEQFDATPGEVPGWVMRQHARGVARPIVYCSVSAVTQVVAALRSNGVGIDRIKWWTAHYGAGEHLCNPGCYPNMPLVADATQWIDHGPYDESVITPGFAGTPTSPGGPPVTNTPIPIGIAHNTAGTGFWLGFSDGSVWSFDGAPFHGSYGTLAPAERQAPADFVAFGSDGAGGYVLVHRGVAANGAGIYRFGPA